VNPVAETPGTTHPTAGLLKMLSSGQFRGNMY
jgi:hypothetical protein